MMQHRVTEVYIQHVSEPESMGVKRRHLYSDTANETEVRGGNISWGLMVQLKAHLGNRWPQMNFLFLPIESDRADNDPSPIAPLSRVEEDRGLHCRLDFWIWILFFLAYAPSQLRNLTC